MACLRVQNALGHRQHTFTPATACQLTSSVRQTLKICIAAHAPYTHKFATGHDRTPFHGKCLAPLNATDSYSNPALYTSDDAFSLASYWNERYSREGGAPFEWYRDYNSLESILSRHLDKSQPVLHVGVGTSRIQFQMHHDGYRHIINVDYASVCIQQLSEMHAGLVGLLYEVADCRNMPQYGDGSFSGGVLDKGTLDALLCGDSDEADSEDMLRECWRVLAGGSSYICITYAPPRSRLQYLLRLGLEWDVYFYEVGQQGWREGPVAVETATDSGLELYPKQRYSHFVYVCTRR